MLDTTNTNVAGVWLLGGPADGCVHGVQVDDLGQPPPALAWYAGKPGVRHAADQPVADAMYKLIGYAKYLPEPMWLYQHTEEMGGSAPP